MCIRTSLVVFSIIAALAFPSVAPAATPRTPSPQLPAFVHNVGQVSYPNGQPASHVDVTLSAPNMVAYVFAGGIHLVQERWHSPQTSVPPPTRINPSIANTAALYAHVDLFRTDVRLLGANTQARLVVERAANGYDFFITPSTGLKGARADRYQQIRYVDVLPGVDMRLSANGKGVKVDYILRPGADPHSIRLLYDGVSSASPSPDGGVRFTTPLGLIQEEAPVAFCQGASVPIKTVLDGNTITYSVGDYDRSQELIIDPQLVWATYYAGKQVTSGDVQTANDIFGNVFLAGTTFITTLPQSPGVFQPRWKARSDGFVAKFTEFGTLLWNTYVGGTGSDEILDMCADTSGSVWICGSLDSGNHPLMDTAGAINYNKQGSGPFGDIEGDTITGRAGFVMRVKPDGTWGDSWIMDGNGTDRVTGIAFKANHLAFCGETRSLRINQKTGYPFGRNNANNYGQFDIFVAHCSPKAGNAERWTGDWLSYYGGSSDDQAKAVAVDAFGNVTCIAITQSNDLQSTDGSALRGPLDVFAIHFRTTGQPPQPSRTWAKYIGGDDNDYPADVAVDSFGNPIIVGHTYSGNFPTAAPYKATRAGITDGFFCKINYTTGLFLTSSYFGGNRLDALTSVAVDKNDRIWFAGYTGGSDDLPFTADAHDYDPNTTAEWYDLTDGFIVQMTANGAGRLYCTYYGADPDDNLPPRPTAPGDTIPSNTDFGYDRITDIYCENNAYISVASMVRGRYMAVTPGAYQSGADLSADPLYDAPFLSYFSNCPDTTMDVTINGTPVLCDNESRILRAPSGYTSYKWNTGARTQQITVSDSGMYTVSVLTMDGCRFHDTVWIAKAPRPTVSAGSDVEGCINTVIRLKAVPSGGTPPYFYKWKRVEPGPQYIDNDGLEEPGVNPNTTSHYAVTVTDQLGCTATDTVLVTIINPSPRLNTDTVVFQELDACEATGTDSVWVVNTMDYPLTLDSARASSSVFSIGTSLVGGLDIAPGDSVRVAVLATPQTAGTSTGSLVFFGSPCNWSITCQLRIVKSQLVASLIPNRVDFGTVLDCEPETRDTIITIRNNGTNVLTLQPGFTRAPFRVVTPQTPVTLAQGEGQQIIVDFNPQATGTYADTVFFPFQSGTCQDTLLVFISGIRGAMDVAVEPPTLNVGTLQGCEDSKDTSVVIWNRGTARASVTLPSNPEVVFTPSGPLTIPGGDSIRVNVSVRPATSGPFTTTLTLGVEPCALTVPLTISANKSGTAVTTPATSDLGEVSSCSGPSTIVQPFTVRFSGSGDGTVSSVSTGPSISTNMAVGSVLANGQDVSFNVLWTPTTDGVLVDSIVMIIEPCSIRRVIHVSGVRTTPSIRSVDALVALGALTAPATGTVRFENYGTDTLIFNTRATANLSIVATRPNSTTLLPGGMLEVDYRAACVPSILDTISVAVATPCALDVFSAFTGTCTGAAPARSTVVLDSASVKVGEKVTLGLRLVDSENLDDNGLRTWRADITYNPMVIVGTDGTPDCFVQGAYAPCTITLTGTRTSTTGLLASLNFTAILGTAAATDVVISNFDWIEDTTALVTTSNGHVVITDVCEEGGTRLLDPKAEAFSINVYPIPAITQFTIEVQGLGSQPGSYALYNYTGQQVTSGVLTSDQQGNALVVVDVSTFGSGTYLLTVDARGSLYRLPVLITR